MTGKVKSLTPMCIYCPNPADSEEHHLPYGLGKFKAYEPLVGRVCSNCNGKCGILDEQLLRSGMEAFFRIHLGIENRRDHLKVNPFYRGSAGARAIEMTAKDEQTGEEVNIELVEGFEARELRHVKLLAEDGRQFILRITDGMTPDQFRQKFDEFGIKTFKQANVFAGKDERPWVESLMVKMRYKSKSEWSTPQLPVVYSQAVVKFTLTSRYFRCIAKIAFHYFLTTMKQFRGDEGCFKPIRDFIMNESAKISDCAPFVSSLPGLLPHGRLGYATNKWGHMLYTEANYHTFFGQVQLFAGPGVNQYVHTVQLGNNPSKIDYLEAYGEFFWYYPKEDRKEYDGEILDLLAYHWVGFPPRKL